MTSHEEPLSQVKRAVTKRRVGRVGRMPAGLQGAISPSPGRSKGRTRKTHTKGSAETANGSERPWTAHGRVSVCSTPPLEAKTETKKPAHKKAPWDTHGQRHLKTNHDEVPLQRPRAWKEAPGPDDPHPLLWCYDAITLLQDEEPSQEWVYWGGRKTILKRTALKRMFELTKFKSWS